MRKGSGGEHCLFFSIREREAGRSVSRMDNACHTAPPPSRLDHIHQRSPCLLFRQC